MHCAIIKSHSWDSVVYKFTSTATHNPAPTPTDFELDGVELLLLEVVPQHVPVALLLLRCELPESEALDQAVARRHTQCAATLRGHAGEALSPVEVVYCHTLKVHVAAAAHPLGGALLQVGCRYRGEGRKISTWGKVGLVHTACLPSFHHIYRSLLFMRTIGSIGTQTSFYIGCASCIRIWSSGFSLHPIIKRPKSSGCFNFHTLCKREQKHNKLSFCLILAIL